MALPWIREDANFDSHPKTIAAGWWGGRAAEAVWRIAKTHGRRGVLKAPFVTGAFLADFTRGGADFAENYQRGLDAAFRAGFLERLEDGSVAVHDWDDYQWDETAAERQKRCRDKRKAAAVTRDVTELRSVTAVTGTPPLPHPTPQEQGKGSDRPAAPPPDATVKDPAPSKRARNIPVDPSSPNGLKDPERIRRFAYLHWTAGPGAGAAYPQEPDADHQIAVDLLAYHRQAKIKTPWEKWVQAIITAYYQLDDQWLREHTYAFRFLTRTRLMQIVATMGGGA